MLISALVLALALQSSSIAAPQRAFIACLDRELGAGLDDKLEPASFAERLKSRCTSEDAAYRAAMVAADRKSGISAAEAAESAADEIGYWRDKYAEDHAMHFADKTRPGK